MINDKEIEIRIEVGLPAAGRKILGKTAYTIIQGIPQMVEKAIRYENLNQQALKEQVALKLDQIYIRQQLETEHLVAFVANGSILPRKSGVSDAPMKSAIQFTSLRNLNIHSIFQVVGQSQGWLFHKGLHLLSVEVTMVNRHY